jgi:hypothetical protein
MTRHSITAVTMAAALGGCAAAQVNLADVKKDPEKAIVVGWGNTGGEILQNTIALPLGVRVGNLYVFKVNEDKVSFGDNSVRLAPGAYDLTISCGIYIGGNYSSSFEPIRANLQAGRIYQLRPRPYGRNCGAYIDDVTETQRAP